MCRLHRPHQGVSHQKPRTATTVQPKTSPADCKPSRFQVPPDPLGREKTSRNDASRVALARRMPPSTRARRDGVCTLRYWHSCQRAKPRNQRARTAS